MDQTFGAVGGWLFVPSPSLVGAPVTEFNELLSVTALTARDLAARLAKDLAAKIATLNQRVRPLLAKLDPEAAKNRDVQITEIKKQHSRTMAGSSTRTSKPRSMPCTSSTSRASRCSTAGIEGENEYTVVVEQTIGDKETLHISLRQPNSPSWRREILLGPGSYTLTANVQTKEVEKLDEGEPSGVGLGKSGVGRPATLAGDERLDDADPRIRGRRRSQGLQLRAGSASQIGRGLVRPQLAQADPQAAAVAGEARARGVTFATPATFSCRRAAGAGSRLRSGAAPCLHAHS